MLLYYLDFFFNARCNKLFFECKIYDLVHSAIRVYIMYGIWRCEINVGYTWFYKQECHLSNFLSNNGVFLSDAVTDFSRWKSMSATPGCEIRIFSLGKRLNGTPVNRGGKAIEKNCRMHHC